MTDPAGNLSVQRHTAIEGILQLIGGYTTATLDAATTIDKSHGNVLMLDPGGAARNVTLPDGPTKSGDLRFIVNTADAAETITLKNSAGSNICTIEQNRAVLVGNAGGSSWNLVCKWTIALS